RIPGIGKAFAQLSGEQRGQLVFEAFSLVGRERHVVRVGAHPEYLRIDELERQIQTVERLPKQFFGHNRNRRGMRKNAAETAKDERGPPLASAPSSHRFFSGPTGSWRCLSPLVRPQPLRPRQLSSASVADLGLSACFCGLARGTASLARARR